MSSITLQSFTNLLGKVNDGDFILSNKNGKEELERVNRGSNFLTRKFHWKQADVSDADTNRRTFEALREALKKSCFEEGKISTTVCAKAILDLDEMEGKGQLKCSMVRDILIKCKLLDSKLNPELAGKDYESVGNKPLENREIKAPVLDPVLHRQRLAQEFRAHMEAGCGDFTNIPAEASELPGKKKWFLKAMDTIDNLVKRGREYQIPGAKKLTIGDYYTEDIIRKTGGLYIALSQWKKEMEEGKSVLPTATLSLSLNNCQNILLKTFDKAFDDVMQKA